MDRADSLVVFTPSGKRGRFARGTTLLTAARRLGVDVDSVCGGRGICGRCKVIVSEGEFAKHQIRSGPESLAPLSEPERQYAEKSELRDGERLSCHAKLQADIVVDVPATSQVHHQLVRKAYQQRAVSVDPSVHLYYVAVTEPSLERAESAVERLCAALREQWQLPDVVVDPIALAALRRCLSEEAGRVTVAVRDGTRVVAVWPGLQARHCGVAIDVGSTTLAAHLCDAATGEVLASEGSMNPQIRFGEDLMSRVSYAMMNAGGAEAMTLSVREAISGLVVRLLRSAEVDPSEVLELTFAGNSIMHHLLLGISPVELGAAPFALTVDAAALLPAAALGIDVNPGASAYVLPCIAGHVGADTAAVLLAEAPWEHEGVRLTVDVGTNAELVLSGRGRILAASSPTGPAFEGAQISCGQRAAPGAIERVRIDRETLEPRFRVIGSELWSDEPGFGESIGSLGVTGICGTGIIEAIAELFLAGVVDHQGRIVEVGGGRTDRLVPDGRTRAYTLHDGQSPIRITQTDVRAIQLAKAALYAGARLLMDRLGVERVDEIRLAGAFGSQIDVTYAMVLGMIPDCDLDRVSAAGNAAGTGAVMALLDSRARSEIEARVRGVEKIELAVEPAFQRHFVGGMAIPHASDEYRELARRVTMPTAPRDPAEKEGPRRRRRRARERREASGEASGRGGRDG